VDPTTAVGSGEGDENRDRSALSGGREKIRA
jgi:hypothetical protein